MHVKNNTTVLLHFRPESCETYYPHDYAALSADPIKLSVLFGSLGAPSGALLLFGFAFVAAAGNLCDHSLLFGFEPRSASKYRFRLLLATFVITACYLDLKPGLRI